MSFHYSRFPLTVALTGARLAQLAVCLARYRTMHSGGGAVLLRRD